MTMVRREGGAHQLVWWTHATILGGPGDDTIVGSPVADFIDGGDGNDTITGGPGATPWSEVPVLTNSFNHQTLL